MLLSSVKVIYIIVTGEKPRAKGHLPSVEPAFISNHQACFVPHLFFFSIVNNLLQLGSKYALLFCEIKHFFGVTVMAFPKFEKLSMQLK